MKVRSAKREGVEVHLRVDRARLSLDGRDARGTRREAFGNLEKRREGLGAFCSSGASDSGLSLAGGFVDVDAGGCP